MSSRKTNTESGAGAASAAGEGSSTGPDGGAGSEPDGWRTEVERDDATVMTRTASPEGSVSRPRRAKANLERGAVVGRYVVLDEIGAGAMGAVYRAYDPELDRSVALKVVDSAATPDAAARLAREAKALAQLSHPNVVAVHDVGSYNGDVFIAMGLVEGRTLRQWRTEGSTPPPLSEVIDVFAAAGRGLAAAHRAGIVHRDFKPDNVLLGDDGRVQVVDFGIARAPEQDGDVPDAWGDTAQWERLSNKEQERDKDPETSQTINKLSAPLTHAGAMLGTPAYMSPEQFRCQPADAKSDQFGFCVALYEALYGRRPFAGQAVVELRANILAGNVRPPPSDSRVPARVRKIVERGLRVAPSERYPSMDDLLSELARDPRATATRVALAAGALLIAALALVAIFRGPAAPTLCTSEDRHLRGVWDEARRAAARDAFLASERPFAAATVERVAAELDGYSQDWVAMRTETCEATHVAGTQSEHLMDLRIACLDDRLSSLSALVDVFTGAVDAETVEKALPAAIELPRLDGCADTRALTAAIPPPEDAATRARVKSLRRRLADARALEATGRYADALAVTGDMQTEVGGVGYEPLEAELLLRTGTLQLLAGEFDSAEKTLREAILHGARARDDVLTADAWIRLMETLAEQARYDDALALKLGTRSAVVRAGDEPRQEGTLEKAIGGLLYSKGQYDLAFEHKQRALDLTVSALGADHPIVAGALNSLGNNYYARGRYDEARHHWERALEIREEALGAEHPLVALSVYNLGIVAYSEARYQRSETMFRRALRLFRQAYGEEHPHTAAAYHAVGNLMLNLGRHADAEVPLRRSLALREDLLGASHPLTGSSLHTLGQVLNLAERPDEAERFIRRALGIWSEKLGAGHPKIGTGHLAAGESASLRGDFAAAAREYGKGLEILRGAFGEEHDHVALAYAYRADALTGAGRLPDAERDYRRALELYEALRDDDHPDLAVPLAGLGECYLAMGRLDDARPLLERALAIRDKRPGGDRYLKAKNEFALARALGDVRGQATRAGRLAASARAVFAADERPSAVRLLASIDEWTRRHADVRGEAVALDEP